MLSLFMMRFFARHKDDLWRASATMKSEVTFVLALFTLCDAKIISDRASQRQGKYLSIFNIVRFTNGPCTSDGGRNGTCYTRPECLQRGGMPSSLCALGYGTCCIFSANCGQTVRENCTYFESTGREGNGPCSLRVCRRDGDISQLRLDFSTFVIHGPSMQSISSANSNFGMVAPSATLPISPATQCLTDSFMVTNPGGQSPPVICGTNNGEHMYVDASSACNDLTFFLGSTLMDTTSVTRSWSIKVTQYTCDYNNLAPSGCTQYFFGMSTGTVRTYNFEGGYHLAHQNQNICIRQERGNCKICWTTAEPTDFAVSGKTNLMSGVTSGSMCCGYGADGMGTMGFDCILIPGAQKMTPPCTLLKANAFCGRDMGLVTVMGGAAGTVCSSQMPFNIRFLSDGFEFAEGIANAEATAPDVGFKLTYIQMACMN